MVPDSRFLTFLKDRLRPRNVKWDKPFPLQIAFTTGPEGKLMDFRPTGGLFQNKGKEAWGPPSTHTQCSHIHIHAKELSHMCTSPPDLYVSYVTVPLHADHFVFLFPRSSLYRNVVSCVFVIFDCHVLVECQRSKSVSPHTPPEDCTWDSRHADQEGLCHWAASPALSCLKLCCWFPLIKVEAQASLWTHSSFRLVWD